MAAFSLRNSSSALGADFRTIARRKGQATAVFATTRELATYLYRMLRFGQDYVDEGAHAYEHRFQHQRLASMRTFAKQMGYELVLINPTG